MPFKPIPAGLFSSVTVNNRLRALYAEIEALKTAATSATTADSAETITIDAFDWRTTHDVAALKKWALEVHELEIKGNKKADTIRAEIDAFLDESEG